MKRNIFTLMLLSFAFLCGCSNDVAEETKTYIFPESYFVYTGTDAADQAEAMTELGEEFCTSAEAVGNSVKLELTDVQRDNMIKRNSDYAESLVNHLLKENKEYSYTGDDSYKKLDFYYDENASLMAEMFAIRGVSSCYAYNQILLNNTEDWNVEITIYNCHTNKVVVHANLPSEIDTTWNAEDWANSYK